MKFPYLSSAFGCLSLGTGTKIIGWFQMACVATASAVIFIAFNDEEIRKQMKGNELEVLVDFIKIFLWSIIFICFAAVALLLLGAHKKKPGYMTMWLVLAGISLISSIATMRLGGILSFIVSLYCTWVVFSHYVELQDQTGTVHTLPSAPGEVLMYEDAPRVVTHNPPLYPEFQKK